MADEKFKAIADEWLGSACGQVWDDAEAGASLAALLSRVDAEAVERGMVAVLNAQDEGCAVFLDGRNESGSHVLPLERFGGVDFDTQDLSSWQAEEIIAAAEAAGFSVGEAVWIKCRYESAQVDEYGRIEVPSCWEFGSVDVEISSAIRSTLARKGKDALGPAEETETKG